MMERYAWVSLQDLFSALNAECNYCILRNYEDIGGEKFQMEAHPDIDLLCDDFRKLKRQLKTVRNPGHFRHKNHYWVRIGQQMVEVGIRCVGDGYYDAEWEKNMLGTRILHSGGFYVMNADNYFYSLLYHAFFHKKKLAKDYLARLKNMADAMGIEVGAKKENGFLSVLFQYMEEKGYYATYPKDITIPIQLEGVPKEMVQGKEAWERRKLLCFPERAARFVLRRVLKA